MELNLIFGDEFWSRLNYLISIAERRIFILSAYIGERDWNQIYKLKKSSVQVATICRDDSGFKPKLDSFLLPKDLYHGKIYVVDNIVLLGSQNLYNANKNGEFSVEFNTGYEQASLIVYQALLKTCLGVSPGAEPVNDAFYGFYGASCPFCGGIPAEPHSIISCPEYNGGFVSEDDCDSYGGDGACKYCIPENKRNLGECYVCDHAGCGFGIRCDTGELLYHEFVKQQPGSIENAKKYLELFNYFANRNKSFAVTFFEMMGFTGNVFNASPERLSWQLSTTSN